VLGISIDAWPSNAEFAKQNGLTFRLLSDMSRQVSRAYGILNEEYQFANRTTFVVDKSGRIQRIEEGRSAVDPSSAISFCAGLKKKAATTDQPR
jgi:peroxiredoxin